MIIVSIVVLLLYQRYNFSITSIALPWIAKSFILDQPLLAELFVRLPVSGFGTLILGSACQLLWQAGSNSFKLRLHTPFQDGGSYKKADYLGEGEACAEVELEVGVAAGVGGAHLIGDRTQIKVAV